MKKMLRRMLYLFVPSMPRSSSSPACTSGKMSRGPRHRAMCRVLSTHRLSIPQIRFVKSVEKVHQRQQGKYAKIELPHQLSLGFLIDNIGLAIFALNDSVAIFSRCD